MCRAEVRVEGPGGWARAVFEHRILFNDKDKLISSKFVPLVLPARTSPLGHSSAHGSRARSGGDPTARRAEAFQHEHHRLLARVRVVLQTDLRSELLLRSASRRAPRIKAV